MLQNHMPSSPTRLPVAVLYFNGLTRLVSNWATLYAAKRQLLDAIDGHSYKQIDPNTIVTDDDVSIRSEQMNDLLEYEFTKEEAAWQLPDRDAALLFRLRNAPRSRADTPQTAENAPAGITPRRNPAPRPDGLIALADICADLGVDPREARALLRKQMSKPTHGSWSFAPEEVESVKAKLKTSS